MDDDFNTPGALAEVFTFIREINTHTKDVGGAAVLRESLAALIELVGILGIDLTLEETVASAESGDLLKSTIELLLELREDARKAKDYAAADKIRDRLGELGVTVSDTKDGSTWKMS